MISFVIPHKGRAEMLEETLRSISLQEVDPASLEVILVSQTPTVAEPGNLNTYGLAVNIHIRPESESISALRNYGVNQAKGEFLAFLDADVFLSPNWAEAMTNILRESETRIIASAMQICSEDAPPLEKIRTNLSNAEVDAPASFLPGRNLLLRKADFARIGGFPEHLITCEDYYFTDKAAQLGELYYSSRANYVHIGEDKRLDEMFKKEIWRGQSNLQSISSRRISLREWPSFVVPIIFAVTLLVFLFAVLLQQLHIAMPALMISLAILLAYSLRLKSLRGHSVSLWDIVKFYGVYFPARALGTLSGLFRVIKVNQ